MQKPPSHEIKGQTLGNIGGSRETADHTHSFTYQINPAVHDPGDVIGCTDVVMHHRHVIMSPLTTEPSEYTYEFNPQTGEEIKAEDIGPSEDGHYHLLPADGKSEQAIESKTEAKPIDFDMANYTEYSEDMEEAVVKWITDSLQLEAGTPTRNRTPTPISDLQGFGLTDTQSGTNPWPRMKRLKKKNGPPAKKERK
jgi:hypothetical protein